MATTKILMKTGTGKPLSSSLEVGELAIDINNGELWSKKGDDTVYRLNGHLYLDQTDPKLDTTLDADGNLIINLSYPADDTDAASKKYVDDQISTGGYDDTEVRGLIDDNSDRIDVLETGGGLTGSSVYIDSLEPASPGNGMQWLETPAGGEATMWIYDGAAWLQHPGGKDGADGADGADGVWTDNGGSISYTGTVTVNGDLLAAKADAGVDAVAVGKDAGKDAQSKMAIAIGAYTGRVSQGERAIAIGPYAGDNNQGMHSIAIGQSTGATDQGQSGVAIGWESGSVSQSMDAVAVGRNAGQTTQGEKAVSVGRDAGFDNQGDYAVGVGFNAGKTTQGSGAIAIGGSAGWTGQGASAIAIGPSAGETRQGAESIAIGRSAGSDDQAANSIIISATGQSSNLSYAGISIEVPGAYLNYNGSDEWHFEGGNVTGGGLRFDSIAQDGSPVIDAKGLISTLATLRNATKDETTVKGLRDAIGDAIGGLIEKFEAEIATQEES